MYAAAKSGAAPVSAAAVATGNNAVSSQTIQESMRLLLLVRAFQVGNKIILEMN